MLHKHILLNHGGRYIYIQPCSLNKAVPCALGKVGKPRTALKDKHLMGIQHTYNGKDLFVRLQTDVASPLLHTVFVSRIHFGKQNSHTNTSHGSALCSCTLQLYILLTISPCYYLRVQLTYLEELHGQCNGTAHTCVNRGYQVLLSHFSSTWERG